LRELQQAWRDKLPEDSTALFAALLAMEQGELVNLLAVCVSSTVDVVTHRATSHHPGAALAQAVDLGMAAWWKPTADGYFKHISKAAKRNGGFKIRTGCPPSSKPKIQGRT